MASSGNFCTLNPLTQPNSGTFSEGNLLFTHTAGAWRTTAGTMCMTTGKWYWEAYQYEDLVGNGFPCGIYDMDSGKFVSNMAGDYPGQSSSSQGANYSCYTNSGSYAQKRYNGTTLSMTIDDGDSGDVWQCAFDADAGKIWFGKNNTWDNNANPALGSNESYASISSSKWAPITCSYNDSNSENYPQNFGQDDTFAGRITAQGNTDDNGHGVFKYAPPTGFLALCSANLPISDDIDPAQTDDDYAGGKQFNTVIYTGNGSTQNITGLGFQPDFVWLKRRDGAKSHALFDSSRGVTKYISTDSNGAETTDTSTLTAFGSDGFSLASPAANNLVNGNGFTYVGWAWRANAGTTASNSEGNITATVQANTKAGFSIITYTGSGGTVSSANPTFGHGLESAPDFLIFKCRSDGSSNWIVWHQGLGGANKYMSLNATSAVATDTAWLSNTAPSSTLITTDNGGWAAVNGSSKTYVCYAWHSVEGFSKFGSYEGNNSSDNSFIYTGFRPRMAFFKNIDGGAEWTVFDTARQTYNEMTDCLQWDLSNGTLQQAGTKVDFLSNGMKVRGNGGRIGGAETYIYGAWGDVPFKYNNTF